MGHNRRHLRQKTIGHEWAKWAINTMKRSKNTVHVQRHNQMCQRYRRVLTQVIETMNRELVA